MFGASKSGSAALPSDPDFEYVTLLLDGNGTNGGQNNTFVDSSTNNFTITRNGNTTQGSFSPYGNLWSNSLFNPNYLTTPANSVFAISGDFTLECWVLSSDSSLDGSTRRRVFHTGGGDIASSLQLLLGTSGGNSAVISVLNNGFLIDGTISVCTGQWVHIAVTRSGTSLKLFVNGVQSGSTATTSQNFNSGTSNTVTIGANSGGGGVWQGYISNMRLITGTALYTSAFTPPTTPLTAISGTQLLTCQSNRFVDNSSNNLTITPTGSPSVQRFSPFEPSAPYSTSVIGGSGYFDGSGDYLQTPSNSVFNFSSTDCTVEFWYYGSGSGGLLVEWGTGASGDMQIELSSGTVTFGPSGGASKTFFALQPNAWNYLAAVKTGTTYYLYINGTRNTTSSGTAASSAQTVNIGARSGGTVAITGYLSDIRISNTAVYTGTTLTVPTSPIGTNANTQLLTKFQNASIADFAMMNDLETVGNAQVSTSVKKFGTGSISFDGTGDYLLGAPKPVNTFGTGDFTIEAWIYPTSFDAANNAIACVWAGSGYGWFFGLNSSGTNLLFAYTGTGTVSFAYTFAANTWYHVAVSRNSGSVRAFVNGNQVGSTQTVTANITAPSTVLAVGTNMDSGPTQYFAGYIDDLRITNGLARYTANFTAPTAPFPTY